MLQAYDYNTEITPGSLNADVTAPQKPIFAIQEACDYHTEITPVLEC